MVFLLDTSRHGPYGYRMANRVGADPSVHVRIPLEQMARLDEFAALLSERSKIPVSRSAALRRVIEVGLQETMRGRRVAATGTDDR
jgi:hypothetical protein